MAPDDSFIHSSFKSKNFIRLPRFRSLRAPLESIGLFEALCVSKDPLEPNGAFGASWFQMTPSYCSIKSKNSIRLKVNRASWNLRLLWSHMGLFEALWALRCLWSLVGPLQPYGALGASRLQMTHSNGSKNLETP